MSRSEFTSLRRKEALSACRRLGVGPEQVIFLEFPDGSLSQWADQAVERVREILEIEAPTELFLPYFRDRHADHLATNRIAKDAALHAGKALTVYEYGTWYWAHWPLTQAEKRPIVGHTRNLVDFLQHLLWTLKDMRYAVHINDTVSLKRLALDEHRTQTTRMGGPDWFVLSDVSDGDWLDSLFQQYEPFHRYTIAAR
jgi:LmbE family N-acetylglucosaminyl deacetylase